MPWRLRFFCLVIATFGTVKNVDADPYESQPRITIRNGHISFSSGRDGNINFASTGQGTIQINGIDLGSLTKKIQSAQTGSQSENADSALGNSGLKDRIISLEALTSELGNNFTAIASQLTDFIGNGDTKLSRRTIRNELRKVRNLVKEVDSIKQLLLQDECDGNPCKNGGTCMDGYRKFFCYCPDNWEGNTCEEDVNECSRFVGTALGCKNGATCVNTPGAYRCECPANWYGVHCAEKLDDCNSASHQELCGHGTCINENRVVPGQPRYRCICDAGWKKSSYGPQCSEDIDECSGTERRCSQNPMVACFNSPGTFHCGHCPSGYTGSGVVCSDINECEVNNGGCSQQPFVQCTNTLGSRSCGPCPTGFVGNGVLCSYVGVCSISRGGCHPLATCTENMAVTGTYRVCTCPPGYIGNGEGLTGCIQSTSPMSCATNPCQHGTCQMYGQNLHCQCEPGYFGTLCDRQEIDPCASSPCRNGGTCNRIPQPGLDSFVCNCTRGFRGTACEAPSRLCHSRVSGNNGTYSLPSEDHPFSPPVCGLTIRVPVNKVVQLNFSEFNIGQNCRRQYLNIYDGEFIQDSLLGKFCNQDLQNQIINSTSNGAYLWFFSGQLLPDTRIKLKWTAVDPVCGGTLNVSDYGAVNSPGYPGNYPLNRTCEWLVSVPFGKRIQFHFATLKLEQHNDNNCSLDYLKIHDGSSYRDPVIGQYCSTKTPPPLTTSGHSALIFFHSDSQGRDTGFHITYASQPAVQGCGGILTNGSGVFSSPNFPDVYQNNLICEWLIRIHPDNRILLTFKEFHLEQHNNCSFDILEVFDGEDDHSPLLGRYCGSDVPDKLYSNSYKLYIRFRSDSSLSHTGFKAEYKTICGGLFTESSGILKSPYYPDNYPSRALCIYNIKAPPGYLIKLTFQELNIESHGNCHYDYVEIHDGESEDSPLIVKLCGAAAPDIIVSTHNFLYLKFETDGSVQTKGFLAEYETIDVGCGGVFTSPEGILSSPLHPDSYPHSKNCSWLLKAPSGFVIQLTFLTFVLEQDAHCRFDYVIVEEQLGGTMIGKYCGTKKPPILTSMGNSLYITFVADETVARDGFTAKYTFLNVRDSCDVTYYQRAGVIRSPGYPERYPANVHCVWVIQAPDLQQISLNVSSFNLEEHFKCLYDYLEIRNGGFRSSPLIGRYCNHQSIPIIRSHSNSLRLEFITDPTMSAPGFEIYFDSFASGCGGKLSSPRGTIISPNYPQPYPLNADCEWLIQVSAGSIISLVFVEIDIEEHDECRYDYVQVFDGSSENSKSLTKICNNQQNHGPVTSTGSSLFIRFRSDAMRTAGGFQLAYQTSCNNKLTKRRGVIESPNFPNSYPHNHNCSWTIEAPKGNNISMMFSHIFMETTEGCEFDYVELIEVNPQGVWISLAKYCGDSTKPTNVFETSSNIAIVRLVTDQSVSREGFRLEYTMKGCGGEISNKPNGVIQSPNYPNGYPFETACFWQISVPVGYRLRLTIKDIDLEATPECAFDYLKVYGGEDEKSVRLLNLCQRLQTSQVINSHGNHMFVHFHSDHSMNSRGFQAEFQQIEGGCGGRLTAAESTFVSPNFPKAYEIEDSCNWLIVVDNMHSVVLEFYDFNLPESEDCVNGFVEVYDGNSTLAPSLGRFCGSQKPENATTSTGNQMYVVLQTDGLNVGTGFRAHYKRGCGQRFLADKGGELLSPGYPDASLLYNCSWIIYTNQPDEKVSLIITHLHFFESVNCSYTSLSVKDGDLPDSPLIGQYCGLNPPPPIISRGSKLHVSLTRIGVFRATYGMADSHCGGTFSSIRGTFISPGYPYSYPEVIECVWTIESSLGNKVHISFSKFSLEDSEDCNKDYVEIHENNEAGPFIGRYCGQSLPSNLTSAHKLWIKFKSDDTDTDKGFLANFEVEHGAVLNASEGEIQSPGYPHKFHESKDYSWTIFVPSGLFVSLRFLTIDIFSHSSSTACITRVEIFDGFDDQAPELGSFCGYQIPDPVTSTGNVVYVKYSASQYYSGSFHLRWNSFTSTGISIIPEPNLGETCMQEILVNSTNETVITSPNYPQNYPDNYRCSYYLRAPHYLHVDLNITDLSLESHASSCTYDSLDVNYLNDANVDQWTLNKTLCGRQNNIFFSSPTNLMKLVFATDNTYNLQGFRAVAKSSCGVHLKQSSGIIDSHTFRSELASYHWNKIFECEYFITVKPRRKIQLNIENFNFPSDNVCNSNYLQLRNGGSSSSPVLGNGKLCGSSAPESFETDSNRAYVKIVMSNLNQGTPDFVLKFTELSQGCGGHIFLSELSQRSVEIKSPNYPNPPPHDLECEWIISSPANSRMRVDFDSDFHLTPNCYEGDHVEYLELLDGGTELAPPLHRFCGNEQPSSVMSSGSSLFIHYVTAVDNPQAGFKATISIAECGGTISAFNALIKSPNYPNPYGNSINCEWVLKMNYGYHLHLKIEDFNVPAPSLGNCSSTDYLEIRYPDAQGSLLVKLCGIDEEETEIDVPGPEAFVRFKSNSARTGRGFSMSMTAQWDACGGYIEEASGVITSPNYPNAVAGARSCRWAIRAPEGRSIKLTFEEFNLPKDEDANLCLSHLRVGNISHFVLGSEPALLCGNIVPAPIVSSSTYLSIRFYSPGLIAGQGFKLQFSTDEEGICGGTLLLPYGEISTPNFTVSENTVLDCKWRVDGDLVNQTIVFRFDVFDLPGAKANYCRAGGMRLFGDGFFLGIFCGNYSSELVITSPFPSTIIKVVTTLSQPSRLVHGTYNISNCGGITSSENAEIYSPQYPDEYPPNTDCHWIIHIPYGITTLHFEFLELEDNCENDYVLIRNGRHMNSPIIGRFCGKKIPHPIPVTNSVTVAFHSDAYGSAKGFKLVTNYEPQGCGGHIVSKKGNFSSPNWPGHYTDNVECIWTFEFSPGYLVQLDFIGRFEIEKETTCSKDYLKIEEYSGGEWVPGDTKCGSTTPEHYISKTNQLRVTFVSNAAISGDGFNIGYSAVCGGNFTEKNGFIFSPNYPESYDDNLNCTYTIGTSRQHVFLSFEEDFGIEDNGCIYDSITINHATMDNTTQQGPYCGHQAPGPRMLQGPVTLRFTTDYEYTAQGFKAKYETIDCGGTLRNTVGIIKSPSFSTEYLNADIDCTWLIVVPSNRVVMLRFSELSLTYGTSCWENFVEIRDGSERGPILQKLCTNSTYVFKSTGNTLTVRYFQQNHIINNRMIAVYQASFGPDQGCGGLKNESSGEIQSPNTNGVYENDLDCSWFLVTDPNKVFNLTFERFDLEPPSNKSCIYDYIELKEEITDGKWWHGNGLGNLIGRYCGSEIPPPMITSSGKIQLLFHTDSKIQKAGFKIHYETIPSPCGNYILNVLKQPQVLTSPGYPNPYPMNLQCRWYLYTDSSSSWYGKRVQLTIHDMDLSCQEDYLQIQRSDDLEYHGNQYYVNTQKASTLRLCSRNHATELLADFFTSLLFHSGPNNAVSKGFNITYQEAGCNRTYRTDSGFITNPGYPYTRNYEKYCSVTITVSEDKTIAAYFSNFFMPMVYETDCIKNVIEIYDGNSTTDRQIGRYCGNNAPTAIFSTGNSLHFYMKTEREGSYVFTYMATDKGRGCGGSIFADVGIITSPLYPQPYNKSNECIWLIAVPGYHTVELGFSTFMLNSSPGCQSNYVEIYNGDSDNLEKRVARYCGSDVPGNHVSTSSQMLVKFVSDTTNNAPGFVLNFTLNSFPPDQSSKFIQANPTNPFLRMN